jgi:hypothetical protein
MCDTEEVTTEENLTFRYDFKDGGKATLITYKLSTSDFTAQYNDASEDGLKTITFVPTEEDRVDGNLYICDIYIAINIRKDFIDGSKTAYLYLSDSNHPIITFDYELVDDSEFNKCIPIDLFPVHNKYDYIKDSDIVANGKHYSKVKVSLDMCVYDNYGKVEIHGLDGSLIAWKTGSYGWGGGHDWYIHLTCNEKITRDTLNDRGFYGAFNERTTIKKVPISIGNLTSEGSIWTLNVEKIDGTSFTISSEDKTQLMSVWKMVSENSL